MVEEHKPDPIESIRADLQRIHRSGLHTEIIGWVIALAGVGLAWLASSVANVLLWYGLATAAGLFFICTGNYIRSGRGRRIQATLLMNSIVAFVLCSALVPIYICIQSANNYSRFKRLPEKVRELYTKRKFVRPGIIEIALLICLIVAGALTLTDRIMYLQRAGQAHPTSHAAAIDTLSLAGFTIRFPGDVHAANFTETVSGHIVPYTTFSSEAPNNGGSFEVVTVAYPSQYFNYGGLNGSALSTVLGSSLNSMVQIMHGTLATKTSSTFGNQPDEEASFTTQTFGGTSTGYIRLFYIGNREYAVVVVGASQNAFQSFANSFQSKT